MNNDTDLLDQEESFDFDELFDNDVEVDGGTEELQPSKTFRFYCSGADHKDRDGNKLCKHKATHRWAPPCPVCSQFYDCLPIRKKKLGPNAGYRPMGGGAKPFKPRERIKTGIPELDRVLGGGMLEGNVLMLGGERGAGKTTLFLQAAYGTARAGYQTLIVGGEMSEQATLEYADRMHLLDPSLSNKIGLYCDPKGVEIKEVCSQIRARRIRVVFWDSLQVTSMAELKGDVGTAQQVNATMNFLSSFAQDMKVAVIIISHLTKEGNLSGTSTGEHLSDGLFRFEKCPVYDEEGEMVPGSEFLREIYPDDKSRQGSSQTRVFLEMVEEGPKAGLRTVSLQLRKRIAKANPQLSELIEKMAA